MTPKQPFLETIYHLRTVEHILFYTKIEKVPSEEDKAVTDFLEGEYEREAADYPGKAPKFNAAAALWGAKTTYYAAQLYLYRKDKVTELTSLLPPYHGTADAGAMLSADLCLRFLPQVKQALEKLDPEDAVLPIINAHLAKFHYSAIGEGTEVDSKEINAAFKDDCLRQLYIDRVIARKASALANNEEVAKGIRESLGDYRNTFWREFEAEKTNTNI